MSDMLNDLMAKAALLDTAVTQLGKRGKAYAEAEQNYRIALAQTIVIERDKGTPVTIISDVCRGTPSIAKLKFERDVAEVSYKSAMEAINTYKLQIRIMDNQVAREWENV